MVGPHSHSTIQREASSWNLTRKTSTCKKDHSCTVRKLMLTSCKIYLLTSSIPAWTGPENKSSCYRICLIYNLGPISNLDSCFISMSQRVQVTTQHLIGLTIVIYLGECVNSLALTSHSTGVLLQPPWILPFLQTNRAQFSRTVKRRQVCVVPQLLFGLWSHSFVCYGYLCFFCYFFTVLTLRILGIENHIPITISWGDRVHLDLSHQYPMNMSYYRKSFYKYYMQRRILFLFQYIMTVVIILRSVYYYYHYLFSSYGVSCDAARHVQERAFNVHQAAAGAASAVSFSRHN